MKYTDQNDRPEDRTKFSGFRSRLYIPKLQVITDYKFKKYVLKRFLPINTPLAGDNES